MKPTDEPTCLRVHCDERPVKDGLCAVHWREAHDDLARVHPEWTITPPPEGWDKPA